MCLLFANIEQQSKKNLWGLIPGRKLSSRSQAQPPHSVPVFTSHLLPPPFLFCGAFCCPYGLHLERWFLLGPTQILSRIQKWQNRQGPRVHGAYLKTISSGGGGLIMRNRKEILNQTEISAMKNKTKQNNIIGRYNGWENSRPVVREDIWECNTLVSLEDENQPLEMWQEASRQKEKRAKIPQIRHQQDMREELKEGHCGWSVTSGFHSEEWWGMKLER